MAKTLKSILSELNIQYSLPNDMVIHGIENDSRLVQENYIFVAIKGYQSDGHRFIDSAIEKGATCLFVEEEEYQAVQKKIDPSIILIPWRNTRTALAHLAKIFYDDPTSNLTLIGVTGTNGKTSITYMIREMLMSAGKKVGLIGTICNYIDKQKLKNPVTTPDSLVLNRLFYEMVQQGIQYAVMEVSSHALYLDRVAGLNFDAIIYTNLSEDHLDFHHTMEEYFNVKLTILNALAQSKKEEKLAIINHDTEYSKQFIDKANNLNLNYVTYGIENQCNYQAKSYNISITECQFQLNNGASDEEFTIPLPGKFNIYNTLSSIAVARFMKFDYQTIRNGLCKVKVPGRFQLVPSSNGAAVIIDYAHTDDAIKNVLLTIKELKPNRVISVFGTGGNRDRGKRPLMGEISGQLSDLTIITSDNPRTEDPERIVDDIVVGMNRTKGSYLKIVDRYSAIKKAIELSQNGDVILIAGKGHEDYQIFKDKTIHFDDTETAEEIIRSLYGIATN